jgi:transcriptional regulator with XRE-family HTH domain
LADKAGVALKTLVDFERGNRAPREATLEGLRATLARAGVEFIPENGGGVGVRLRKAKKRRT